MKHQCIILAAGQGSRLRPLTDHIPKCMVQLANKPLIEYQLSALKNTGIEVITVVTGYKEEIIDYPNIQKVQNPVFDSTNMVYSLFCAESQLKPPFIITYGDIVYKDEVLNNLMEAEGDIIVVSDKGWKKYWEDRNEDIFEDAETFIKADDKKVKSLGKKPTDVKEIQGQYIGMTYISEKGWEILKKAYAEIRALNDTAFRTFTNAKNADNVYMTDLLNFLAQKGALNYMEIDRSWFEVDTPDDLALAEKQLAQWH
jgi:L-glutamine-phosphate cytidylyltransferase